MLVPYSVFPLHKFTGQILALSDDVKAIFVLVLFSFLL